MGKKSDTEFYEDCKQEINLIQRRYKMNIDRIVLAFAGTVITISLILGSTVHPYWFFMAAFVGLTWSRQRLPVSALSPFC